MKIRIDEDYLFQFFDDAAVTIEILSNSYDLLELYLIRQKMSKSYLTNQI